MILDQYFPEKAINKNVKLTNFKAVYIAKYYYKNILLQSIPYIITITPFASVSFDDFDYYGQGYVEDFVRTYKGHRFLLEISATEMLINIPEVLPKNRVGFFYGLLGGFGLFSSYSFSDKTYEAFCKEEYKKLHQQLSQVEKNMREQIDIYGVEFPQKSEPVFSGIDNLRIDLEEYLDCTWWKAQEEFFVTKGLGPKYKPEYNSSYSVSREEFIKILAHYYNQNNPRGYQNVNEEFLKSFLHRRQLAYLQQWFDNGFVSVYHRTTSSKNKPLEDVEKCFYFLKNIGEVFLEKNAVAPISQVNVGYFQFCKFFFWKTMYRKIKKIEKF